VSRLQGGDPLERILDEVLPWVIAQIKQLLFTSGFELKLVEARFLPDTTKKPLSRLDWQNPNPMAPRSLRGRCVARPPLVW
jgi:hypothetical protein